MTVVLPHPVALTDPPGSVQALGSVVDQVVAAGYAAGLTVHLLEPAGALRGWQGADATVAATEVGATLAVAADLQQALATVEARLTDHLELWRAVLARVARLRDDQRARFADAGARLAVLTGVPAETASAVAGPEALALVAAVTAEDADRGTEHRALLEALADDAAAAAGVLAAATRPFGGSGRPGDHAAVTIRLAGQLPGWGAEALTRLGREAADELARAGTVAELDAAVACWRRYAGVPGLADALVGGLGSDGVGWLLTVLAGRADAGRADPLAEFLARLLGSGTRLPGGQVEQVLAGLRLDPDASGGQAIGMGLVLAAPGAGATLAARWGRQLLAREAVQGARAGAAGTGGGRLDDPVEAALAAVAGSGDAAAAALLLADPEAWRTLLSRPWPGGTGSLAAVVELAGSAPEAGRVARAALAALGEGLTAGGGAGVLDDTGALSRVRAQLTALVAGQPGVVLPVLGAGVTGAALDTGSDAALRGLGYLVADDRSAVRVGAAVRAALQRGAAVASAGEVTGALVAVLEYGQRLRYALAWSHEQSRAVDAEILWKMAVSAPLSLVSGRAGEFIDVIEAPVADFFDANGDVEIAPDAGRVRTADDAARLAVAVLEGVAAPAGSPTTDQAAREGFARAAAVLGRLAAPQESVLDRIDDVPEPDGSHRQRVGKGDTRPIPKIN